MPMPAEPRPSNAAKSPRQNHLLAVLPASESSRMFPHLELVRLPLGQALYESGDKLDHVYFPANRMKGQLLKQEFNRARALHHLLTEVDISEPRRIMREHKERTGETLSLTAYVVACLARAAAETPAMRHGRWNVWQRRALVRAPRWRNRALDRRKHCRASEGSRWEARGSGAHVPDRLVRPRDCGRGTSGTIRTTAIRSDTEWRGVGRALATAVNCRKQP